MPGISAPKKQKPQTPTPAPNPTPKGPPKSVPLGSKPPGDKAAEPSPPQRTLASAAVPVELTCKTELLENYQFVIAGTSNLPLGTIVLVAAKPQDISAIVSYSGKAVVDQDGNYRSAPLGNKEVGALPYLYDVSASVRFEDQPPVVREHFANNKDNLQGPLLVKKNPKSYYIEATQTLDLLAYDTKVSAEEAMQQRLAACEAHLAEVQRLYALLMQIKTQSRDQGTAAAEHPQWAEFETRYQALKRNRKVLALPYDTSGPFHLAERDVGALARAVVKNDPLLEQGLQANYDKALREAEEKLVQIRQRI